MKIYIASSWKNQHAVEMLTSKLRKYGHEILSFVENQHGEMEGHKAIEDGKPMDFEDWILTERAHRSFEYDTEGATKSDLVIYISPSGTDAWAEVGAAWESGVPIFGLYAKGEQSGLMRKMVCPWFSNYKDLIEHVKLLENHKKSKWAMCGLCDVAYDIYSEDAKNHEHPEPQSGPPRDAWIKSGMKYKKWIESTPEGKEWAIRYPGKQKDYLKN